MTNFYVTYTLPDKESREAYYREVCEKGIVEKSRAEEGCIRYSYFYPCDSDNTLFLWEQWESREAQAKHTTQPHFAELGELKAKYGAQTEIIAEDQVIG